ncbi:hypothetical protein KL922_004757 [Ogataea haglerorum]|nr:hypothetical protein KL922_004757 [Ogataea haglerorum]
MGFGRSVLAFPSELFSLDTRQFLQLAGAEVAAMCLAYGGSGLIARVAAVLERSAAELARDAVSLAVALAWTKNGCREKIFARLEQHCADELERQKCLVLDRVVELSGAEYAQFDLQIEDAVAELFQMVVGPVSDELVHFLPRLSETAYSYSPAQNLHSHRLHVQQFPGCRAGGRGYGRGPVRLVGAGARPGAAGTRRARQMAL